MHEFPIALAAHHHPLRLGLRPRPGTERVGFLYRDGAPQPGQRAYELLGDYQRGDGRGRGRAAARALQHGFVRAECGLARGEGVLDEAGVGYVGEDRDVLEGEERGLDAFAARDGRGRELLVGAVNRGRVVVGEGGEGGPGGGGGFGGGHGGEVGVEIVGGRGRGEVVGVDWRGF